MLQQLKDLLTRIFTDIRSTTILDDINRNLDTAIADHPQALEEARHNAETKAKEEAKALTDRLDYLNKQLNK